MEEIASRSFEPELTFGNDADDMRSPGPGIDPRVMVGDLSNDAVGYAEDRMKFVQSMLPKLKEKYKEDGESYQELRTAFNILPGQFENFELAR